MLYEHQSTYNPNMPLRNLFYIARLLEKEVQDQTLYSSTIVPIPTPKFIVFYNGSDERPERETLKLSDAFEKKTEEPELELKVLMLNMNPGKNQEILEKYRLLHDYIEYVTRVRTYANEMDIEQAVEPKEGGAYQQAISVLYAVAHTLKMSYKTDYKIEGFFEYVVPPLEGFWWQENIDGVDYTDKSRFHWISVIRLPDFITQKDFEWAVETATKKKTVGLLIGRVYNH